MMYINTDHIKVLILLASLDERGEWTEAQTEQVHVFLDALKEDAILRAINVYEHVLKPTHPSLYPWSTVRRLKMPAIPANLNPTALDQELVNVPPALILILGRKPYLPKEKPGNNVDLDLPEWKGLKRALTDWNPGEVSKWIGTTGWVVKTPTLKTPPKKPGPIFAPPAPKPDEPDDTPGGIDLPPIDPPDDPINPPDDEPDVDPNPDEPDVLPNDPNDQDDAQCDSSGGTGSGTGADTITQPTEDSGATKNRWWEWAVVGAAGVITWILSE